MWLVKYDDGDREDYSARELAAVLVSTESEDEDGGAMLVDSELMLVDSELCWSTQLTVRPLEPFAFVAAGATAIAARPSTLQMRLRRACAAATSAPRHHRPMTPANASPSAINSQQRDRGGGGSP
jgi:hypothetical protein